MSETTEQRVIHDLEQRAEHGVHVTASGAERLAERLHDVDDRVRGFVSDRPLIAIGAALGVGYLVGKLVSRR